MSLSRATRIEPSRFCPLARQEFERSSRLAWWLFVRGAESTQVDVTRALTLVVKGPGRHRMFHHFVTERELAEFALALEQGLVEAGWRLEGFEAERRSGADRRRQPRIPSDRRIR